MKDFSEFINENLPWGAENDPNAPWNERDAVLSRETDWIDEKGGRNKVKFDLLSYSDEIALLHSKVDDNYYAGYFYDDIDDYVLKNEDGEKEAVDDAAVLMWATDMYASLSKHPVGVDPWEEGERLVRMDSALVQLLIGQGNARTDKTLKGLSYLVESEEPAWMTGGIVLILGKEVDGKKNLYAGYIKKLRMLGNKKPGTLEGKIATLSPELYRISLKDDKLTANRIQYDSNSLKNYIGISQNMQVPLNGNDKTPLWWKTVNSMSMGVILRDNEEEIRKLDVKL